MIAANTIRKMKSVIFIKLLLIWELTHIRDICVRVFKYVNIFNLIFHLVDLQNSAEFFSRTIIIIADYVEKKTTGQNGAVSVKHQSLR